MAKTGARVRRPPELSVADKVGGHFNSIDVERARERGGGEICLSNAGKL